jgi:hypothetical protein
VRLCTGATGQSCDAPLAGELTDLIGAWAILGTKNMRRSTALNELSPRRGVTRDGTALCCGG